MCIVNVNNVHGFISFWVIILFLLPFWLLFSSFCLYVPYMVYVHGLRSCTAAPRRAWDLLVMSRDCLGHLSWSIYLYRSSKPDQIQGGICKTWTLDCTGLDSPRLRRALSSSALNCHLFDFQEVKGHVHLDKLQLRWLTESLWVLKPSLSIHDLYSPFLMEATRGSVGKAPLPSFDWALVECFAYLKD